MIGELISAIKNADVYSLIAILLTSAVLFLVCMPSHEFAHAYAAYKLGDPTAKYQGRLTLNPFKHLDVLGMIMILVLGVGYAKAVPVNMLNFKNRKRDMALVSIAGPLMNLIFGIVFVFLNVLAFYLLITPYLNAHIMEIILHNNISFEDTEIINSLDILLYDPSIVGKLLYCLNYILATVASISISLAIFNLIPIPPFDGSRILGYFLPDKIYYKIMQYEHIIFIVVLGFLWFGFLDGPLATMIDTVTSWLYTIFSLPFGGLLN